MITTVDDYVAFQLESIMAVVTTCAGDYDGKGGNDDCNGMAMAMYMTMVWLTGNMVAGSPVPASALLETLFPPPGSFRC